MPFAFQTSERRAPSRPTMCSAYGGSAASKPVPMMTTSTGRAMPSCPTTSWAVNDATGVSTTSTLGRVSEG